jgi:hypothetical protein
MRKSAFAIIGIASTLLVMPPVVFAENSVEISNNGKGAKSDVNIRTNTGNNTICVNGKCTTSEGKEGKSTVCINGKCTTSEGDINIKSEDGNTRVNIDKNGDSSVRVEQKSDNSSNKVEIKQGVEGTSSSKLEKGNAKKQTSSTVQKIKEKRLAILNLINEKLRALREIITFKFLFNAG